jgi:hypothetical protein
MVFLLLLMKMKRKVFPFSARMKLIHFHNGRKSNAFPIAAARMLQLLVGIYYMND